MSNIINPCCCVNIMGVFWSCTDVTILKVKLHWVQIPGAISLFSTWQKCFLHQGNYFTTFSNLQQSSDRFHRFLVDGQHFQCVHFTVQLQKWVCLVSKVLRTFYRPFASTNTSWCAPWGFKWADKRISVKARPAAVVQPRCHVFISRRKYCGSMNTWWSRRKRLLSWVS